MTSAFMVVHVERLVPEDRLDHKDRNKNGQCAVEGDYLFNVPYNRHPNSANISDELKEVTLDIFHSSIPISMLENYDISVRPFDPSRDTNLTEVAV